jgi:glucokinase
MARPTDPRAAVKRRSPLVIIGVDVGGTSVSGGLVTAEGAPLAVVERATHEHGPGSAVDQVLDLVRHLHAEAGRRAITVEGVGVGLPGIVDVDKGMMTGEGGNFVPEFAKLPIAERIREVTGLPAFVDNDVNALALAEHRYGAGRGVRALVLLALGTGPGGAVILNDELVRGRSGYAGEFGHVPLMLDGAPCVCGGHGCAATYLSGRALAQSASEWLRHQPASTLGALGGGGTIVTARTVFAAAQAGDAFAGELVDRVCEALGATLGTILNGLNPDLVVVTGGLAESLVPLEGEILRRAGKYAFPRVLADTTIRITASSKRDTVRGGAALFLYETERRRRLPPAVARKRR